jgi:DNA repair protein RAD50
MRGISVPANNHRKSLTRDLNGLQNERELKTSDLRAKQDENTSKTLQLGEMKSKQQARMREEAALKELQDTLASLQEELKVSLHPRVRYGMREVGYKADTQTLDVSAQAAEAPWRDAKDQLDRHRNDRANAENDASLQVALYQSSLSEVENKHKACVA